ncbi:mechanosensitive ion channel family protein [Halopseudomonas salegens]|uniref:Mechanosensitive ion channel n=1 Tax=Halopseudomonas salegens TaxID=1434072 RepID=A0A1H2H3Q9_9GAMM|nr:mechanosensitive ion channel domain-containing protein [Halopseudomonas salegens]SDU26484.1 Mechanosensitive ion channel [Halopseudomonas salegens]
MSDRLSLLLQQAYLFWTSPLVVYQVIILLFAAGITLFLRKTLSPRLESLAGIDGTRQLRHLLSRSGQRLLAPLSLLLWVMIGRSLLLGSELETQLLDLAIPLLLSMAGVRLVVYLLRKGFPVTPALKTWENIISFSIWTLVALHLVGILPHMLQLLDSLAVTLGETRISLLYVLKLLLLVALMLSLAFWLSALIERRMRGFTHVSPGLQVALGKFSRVFLLTLAVLLSLNLVGIDLTTLTVFGGALGVGLGFGLQRITSNFISGFILILDRSIKPGDVVTIGESFGWVQELRARYIVVRNRDGVDTLIPNENVITNEVINWSYADRNIRLRIQVEISYDDDPEQAMELMQQAASVSPRALQEPPALVNLVEFGDNGILLELRVWIADPEAGVGSVRSAINLAIWRAFKQANITIPYPQRDLHIKGPLPRQE